MKGVPVWLLVVLGLLALALVSWIAQQVEAFVEKAKKYFVGAVIILTVVGTIILLGGNHLPAISNPAVAAPDSEKLLCPTPGFKIGQGFGPTSWTVESPYTYQGTYYPHFHTGIDILANMGVEIHAAEEGNVSFSGKEAQYAARGQGYGYGLMVEVTAGNRVTRYAHMSKILANTGQHVARGQVIGLVGSTGASTGPHLHFGVNENGGWVNPVPLMESC